ncbi:MAG: bifunctional DNA-formamidopyrimidine glycosylase/DNA-(apurinic or apyrimidinic site) lyase [Polyangiales bacterium]
MPELPEVECTRLSLEPYLPGMRLCALDVRAAQLREPVDEPALRRWLLGQTVQGLRRRAKYLLIDFSGGGVLLLHLGMSGRLRLLPAHTPWRKHVHLAFDFGAAGQLRFEDPRRFGMVQAFAASAEAEHRRLCQLGIEPLSPACTGAWLYQATRGRRRPIKNWLMDSHQIVGVGNIYACESLFRAGINPRAHATVLSRPRCTRLALAIQTVLREAIQLGGTTLRDFHNAQGEQGWFRLDLATYGRKDEPCPRCQRPIRCIRLQGRSTYFCPHCQPA